MYSPSLNNFGSRYFGGNSLSKVNCRAYNISDENIFAADVKLSVACVRLRLI